MAFYAFIVSFLGLIASNAFTLSPPSRLALGTSTELRSEGVSYLSEVEEDGKPSKKIPNEVPTDPRAHVLVTESVNAGPTNYEGFIDGDGFDGGDGQVGCVGDGSNAMETFDKSQSVQKSSQLRADNAIGGSESKKTRSNVWGYSTGYAEELKKRGMVEIDEYGEDRLRQRRQQLENFRNQQEVRMQKEGAIRDLSALQGKEYQPARHGAYLKSVAKENEQESEIDVVQGFSRESVSGELKAGDTIDGEVTLVARLENRDGVTLKVNNEFSTFNDYVAGFTAGSSTDFSVSPREGTFNRRGGDPLEFVVKFEPKNYKENYQATLVIQAEDFTKTFKCEGFLN